MVRDEPTPPSSLSRRHAAAAALTLFGLLCGHTILEVARDALFLTRLSANELPLTYLVIAAVSTIAAQADTRLLRQLDDRKVLSITLATAALGALGFHALFGSGAGLVPRAFYVWTGMIATVAVAQFWRLLADVFTVGEAKRLFAPIGAGGALGAMAGAAITELAQNWMDPRGLLGIGSVVMATSAFLPSLLPAPEPGRPARAIEEPERRSESRRDVRRYGRGLLLLVTVTAASATLVDFAFKSLVQADIAPAALGTFFGRFYFGLNLLSLIVQVLVVPRLLRVLGVGRALLVLPITIGLGALGVFLLGGVGAAIALRAADGGLRQSLHRSTVELLYFPLSSRARKRYKGSIDALGQRLGQALGSLAILGAMIAGIGPTELSLAIVGLAVGWAALSSILRRGYLDLFRANLRRGTIESRVEVPMLDLHSLESLVRSLGSEHDEEVLATLDLLVEYDRARLVPPLLLYHPSRAVVLRTLEILGEGDRDDYLSIARRLLDHEDEETQAAAMRAIARSLAPAELVAELGKRSPLAVRAGAQVALVARGLDAEGRAKREIEEGIASGTPAVRLALARAVRLQRSPSLRWILHGLASHADADLRRELARGFGALRDPSSVGTLIHWVGERHARAEARDALVAIGEPALSALAAALGDPAAPRELRGHLPRTIARFADARAAQILFDQLDHEADGWVRYKILRALRRLHELLPALSFDRDALERHGRHALARASRMLAGRIAVREAHRADPARRTPTGQLLEPVLREKEEQAIDRAIRIFVLGHPRESVNGIVHALRSSDRRLRAESRELLSNLAPPGCAVTLGAMLDDAPDEERLARALAGLGEEAPSAPSYVSLLRELIGDESEAVRSIAAHHAGELGIVELEDSLRDAERRAIGPSRELVRRALATLRAPRPESRSA